MTIKILASVHTRSPLPYSDTVEAPRVEQISEIAIRKVDFPVRWM